MDGFFALRAGFRSALLIQKSTLISINIEKYLDFITARPYLMISIHKFTICLLK